MAIGGNININIQANFAKGTETKLRNELNKIGKNLTLNIGRINIDSAAITRAVQQVTAQIGQIGNASNRSANQTTQSNQRQLSSLNGLINAYRSARISTDQFVNSARAAENSSNFRNRSIQEQIRLINTLESAQRRLQASSNETNRINSALRYSPELQSSKQASALSRVTSAESTLRPMVGNAMVDQTRVASLTAELNRLRTAASNISNIRMNQQWSTEFTRLSTQLRALNSGFQETRRSAGGFFSDLAGQATKMLTWTIIGGALFGTFNKIKEGVQYVYELDNALNEIRIVTGQSQVEVEKLATSYNRLGKEMNVTTMEITKTAVDLYRQGLAAQEVEERMKGIIQYAKISGLALGDSNKIITATMNATGASANKTIDIFALLGDETSSGADEIGIALQRVASTADSMGVSIETASAWIATISSKTRESAATIGNSLKGILSRYASIKEQGFNEEDATNINQVTKALRDAAGINAINPQTNQLRNFSEVMDELMPKWDSLDENNKRYIATTLAG